MLLLLRRLVLALVLLEITPAFAAAPAVPDTAAGRQFSIWLQAINGDAPEMLLAFSRDHFALRASDDASRKRAEDWLQTGQTMDGFDVVRFESAGASELTAIARARNLESNFFAIRVEVDPNPPNLVTGFRLGRAPRPSDIPPIVRMTEALAIAALKAELDKESAEDRFAGAVMISRNGKRIFEAAYGLADREQKIPNSIDSRFRVGSMNKMFTGLAVTQLVEAGKIRLDDKIETYLPDYPNKEVASKVTIHQLLTHTGGVGDFGGDFKQDRNALREPKDYVARFGNHGLSFEPGAKWEYSSYGYDLLGRIIEIASGQSYYDYVREHIFKPAGMKSTDSLPEDRSVPGRVVGYTKWTGPLSPMKGPPHSIADLLGYRGTPAGSGYSTVGDMTRYAEALVNNKLLSLEFTRLLTTGMVETGRPDVGKYSYGLEEGKEPDGVPFFGHRGGGWGMNGELMIFPDSGYVITVLVNVDPPAASRIAQFVSQRLPAKKSDEARAGISPSTH